MKCRKCGHDHTGHYLPSADSDYARCATKVWLRRPGSDMGFWGQCECQSRNQVLLRRLRAEGRIGLDGAAERSTAQTVAVGVRSPTYLELEAERDDLRRQLAECQAQLAQSDAAQVADAEDYPPLSDERLARLATYADGKTRPAEAFRELREQFGQYFDDVNPGE